MAKSSLNMVIGQGDLVKLSLKMEGGWGDRASVGEWLLKEATLVSAQYTQPLSGHTQWREPPYPALEVPKSSVIQETPAFGEVRGTLPQNPTETLTLSSNDPKLCVQ